MKSRINYTKPSITSIERAYVQDAMENSWGDGFMYYLDKFESMFAEWLGVKYAIATSSCTGALHIGLMALGIKPGDEVIVPENTWIATASAVTYVGDKPVFVDILPDTWCIDPEQVEKAITNKTKAIIAVHLYGNAADMKSLECIGKIHNIPIIEDAAQGIGTEIHEEKAGSIGAFGVFSFHASKTITTGEGGMLVTNDQELHDKALKISNHGRSRTKQFWFDRIGTKYKMHTLQAAIGCGQMERINEIINRKREIFEYYHKHLSQIEAIEMNPEPQCTKNGYWMPTVVFSKDSGITRERLQHAFKKDNIDARVFFYPLSLMPMFESKPENINAYDIPERAMNLPSFYDITEQQQERVIVAILRAMSL